MNFTETYVAAQPEILKRKLGGELLAEITLDSSAFTDGVCKAGNPISADGKTVNDGTATGILIVDVYEGRPVGTIVKAFGCVDEAKANANAGITIATAAKTALSKLVFE